MKRFTALVISSVIILTLFGCSGKDNAKNINVEKSSSSVSDQKEQNKDNNTTKANSSINSGTTAAKNKKLPKIQKGKIKGNSYINKSLGFKITLPKGWEVYTNDEDEPELENIPKPDYDYCIQKWWETQYGYDFRVVAVQISTDTTFKSLDDYKNYLLGENFNDDPSYMYTEEVGTLKIGNREYCHIAFRYPVSDDVETKVYSDIIFTYDNGVLVTIDFDQLDEKEINNFIKNNIIPLE